jgi:superfamily II DNA or RNA helicase
MIVRSIRDLPEDWTVLLFASSVENAETLAAMLAVQGVPAVAISGGTDPAERRYYVERFRKGDIRVITNYAVLAQGFDAPAVRAVYVTRPTFSPNVYQQMIGRGLRGRLNGGSDEVLIVNVQDNFDQFGERLAFYDFEYLWSGTARG